VFVEVAFAAANTSTKADTRFEELNAVKIKFLDCAKVVLKVSGKRKDVLKPPKLFCIHDTS